MTNTAAIWYFESVNLYRILCPQKVKKLADTHVLLTFKRDQFIPMPDDASTHLYLIVSGRIKIGRAENGIETVSANLTQGEVFGGLSITDEAMHRDFAQATDNVTVCLLTTGELKNLMYDNKELSFKILKLVGLRIVKFERKLELLVFKAARTRVVEFLRDTATGKGVKVGTETMIPTKLTHKDIASLTGTSRQAVTIILNDLKDKNFINFNRKQILITDMESFM